MNSKLGTRNSKPRAAAGFTLIELLVALFILALALPTIYMAYSGAVRISTDSGEGDRVYGMARSAVARFMTDLESICARDGVYQFRLKQEIIGGQPVPVLAFASAAHLPLDGKGAAGAPAAISYYIEKSDKGDFTLMRKDALIIGEGEDPAAQGFPLCGKILSISMKFYDRYGAEHETWNSDSDSDAQKNRAPSAVLVDLKMGRPGDPDPEKSRRHTWHFLTRIKVGVS